MRGMKTRHARENDCGFTLTETAITAGIVGTLAAVSLPSYVSQIDGNCQRQAETMISQALSQAQAFNDEFRKPPNSWSDLDNIGTIMTINGPATNNDFKPITLKGCRYTLEGNQEQNVITFQGRPSKNGGIEPQNEDNKQDELASRNKLNVIGCINLATGASDIQRGDNLQGAETANLQCKQS